MTNLIEEIALNWNIGSVTQINKVNSSTGKVHSIIGIDGQKYYFKEKKNLTEIDMEIDLYKVLSRYGIETSVPLVNKLDKYFVETKGKYYCLYKALPGKIYQEHFDDGALERGFLYGKAIALLHKGLKESGLDELFPEMKLKEQLEDWAIPTILKEIDNNDMFQSIVSELNLIFFPNVDLLAKQIIHRDTHPGNILLKENQIIGFLDFDISTKGIRLFDLCYCSTSILSSKFSEASKREMWPNILRELVRGYNSENNLSQLEIQSIFYVILSIQIIFTAYFYDLENKDIAKINLETLYWIYNNKLAIQEAILTEK